MGERARERFFRRTTEEQRLLAGIELSEAAVKGVLERAGLPREPRTPEEAREGFRALRRAQKGA